ncbi:MAG TPA: serine/threonine-protein kinase [Gemmatimonadaceae bacterium]|nr:serine/threonine-protein kinase [Gemmatimonadaceae bacterium]
MELRQRVQESLSGTHTIERELGGGGMSRVFVASERRLGRKVVVKVLAPELAAGMSAERFEREIQLAASLQQANILPVISAGDMEGIPFYTMPYVEGESLRARLAGGPVPLAQAVDILRDVGKALAYAHERGVVHRDIKPDNILLSGRTAVVADFGIAKAIVAAQEKPAGATLTQLGTAVGTPAYMAPEQAAGDPDTDHRADLYAFGCMAYELLAGQPPFHGLPPHKLVAAHMNELPRDLRELRPDVPAPLATLVMQCLAKNPSGRPANADELLRQLDSAGSLSSAPALATHTYGRSFFLPAMGIYAAAFILVAIVARLLVDTQGLPEWVFGGALVVMALGFPVVLLTGYTQYVARKAALTTPTLTPRGTMVRAGTSGTLAQLAVKASPHVSWRRTARGGIAALTVFALAVAGFLVLRVLGIGPAGSLLAAGKISAQDRVVVAAFDAVGRDSALGDVVSEAVRTNLSQSRAVQVVTTSSLVAALQRMQRKPTDRVDLALARELAVREGMKAVVAGTVTPVGTSYIITTRLVSAESGDELAVYRETAKDAADIIPTVDRLTRQLRGRIGESLKSVADAPALAQVTTSSLDALRAFAAGLRANDVEGQYLKAIPLFEDAIARDSTFAAAYVQLAYSLGNARVQPARRDSLMARAFQLRDRLPERERYNIEGAYYVGNDRPKAIAAFERAVAIDSFNNDVLNSLALTYGAARDYGRAERLLRRAVRNEPENGVIISNLAGALVAAGKLDDVDSLLAEMRARKIPFPTARRESDVLYLRGQFDSAETLMRAAMRGANPSIAPLAMDFVRNIVALRGRFRESDSLAAELAARSAARGERPDRLAQAITGAMTDGWFRGKTEQAIARLDSIVRASSGPGTLPAASLYNLGSTFAILGATDRARAMLKLGDAAVRDSVERRRRQSQRTNLEGDIASAENRIEDAVRAYRRSEIAGDGLPEGCPFCAHASVGMAYDRANMADSAIANLERYLSTPSPGRVFLDRWLRAPAHKRLGELYEAKGDNAKAVSHYTAFVRLWERADPDMQPKVAEVRTRMERILKTLPR